MTARLTGAPAAPGVAAAPPFVLSAPLVDVADTGPVAPPEAERARLMGALAQAAQELTALAERVAVVAPAEAKIFEAHAAFAEDPELAERAGALVDQGASATSAVREAFAGFRTLLAASGDEYLSARTADLDDVCMRAVALLAGVSHLVPVPPVASVILARELTPSQTAELPRDRIAALVTETGSPTSHAAILARTLGIPAVVGVHGALALAASAAVVAVDGRVGEILIDPGADELDALARRADHEAARRAELSRLRDEPGRTADGQRVELAANIAGRDDLAAAVAAGAEGAGLVRTELLFQSRRVAPSVAEQEAYYREVLDAFPQGRVVFRTLDIGSDKPVPFVARQPEPNPALGLRGVRMSLRSTPALVDGGEDAVADSGRYVRSHVGDVADGPDVGDGGSLPGVDADVSGRIGEETVASPLPLVQELEGGGLYTTSRSHYRLGGAVTAGS